MRLVLLRRLDWAVGGMFCYPSEVRQVISVLRLLVGRPVQLPPVVVTCGVRLLVIVGLVTAQRWTLLGARCSFMLLSGPCGPFLLLTVR